MCYLLLIRSTTKGSVYHVGRKAELTGDVFTEFTDIYYIYAKRKHGGFFLKPELHLKN